MRRDASKYLIRRALKHGRWVDSVLIVRPSAYGARRYGLKPLAEYAVVFEPYAGQGLRVRRWHGHKTWQDYTCVAEPPQE